MLAVTGFHRAILAKVHSNSNAFKQLRAFANIAITSSRPVLLKTRGTQNLCSSHRPTPVDLDSFYNLPAFLKSNDRWNWLSLYFSCASVSRELLFAARFAHGRREAGIVRPVQGQKRFHE